MGFEPSGPGSLPACTEHHLAAGFPADAQALGAVWGLEGAAALADGVLRRGDAALG